MEAYGPKPVLAISTENEALIRSTASFHPSIWGDYFLQFASDFEENFPLQEGDQLQEQKGKVKIMLTGLPDKYYQQLDLIDAIQRLGIAYHFENEIEASLRVIYDSYDECNEKDGDDLYTIALRFRLLRQQGHNVSSDVFHRFKNSEGDFRKSLVSNIKGMLSLYEAANFGLYGESILEEALIFTTSHLQSMLISSSLSKFLATQVNQALKLPIQKTLTRIGARQYISIYQEDNLHDQLLLNFAKMDFNRLQKLHQKELSDITKWWKDLDCPTNFPFARDRLVECYFWSVAVYFEPKYCLARRFLTKVISISSIIDDIFDAYGTLEELILFTDAIERFHTSAMDQLPSYMRHSYGALLDIYSEMEDELIKESKSERVNYSKSEMKKLVRAYLQEAKWFHKGYVPTFEEYMKVALVTGGYMMLSTTSLVGMGDSLPAETFDWVTNEPLIVRAASVISRLTDDVVGHEFEQERGHVASAVECYMNQYGTSKQETIDELEKQVKNAWKDMNKECLNLNVVPKLVWERVINLARFINLVYKDEDGYTHSEIKLKDFITAVFIDPMPI